MTSTGRSLVVKPLELGAHNSTGDRNKDMHLHIPSWCSSLTAHPEVNKWISYLSLLKITVGFSFLYFLIFKVIEIPALEFTWEG